MTRGYAERMMGQALVFLKAQAGVERARAEGRPWVRIVPTVPVAPAWHAFVLRSQAYVAFCNEHAGRYIHQEWDRLGRTDSLDLHSPDRPPDRTVDWLIKSPRFIQATPVAAKDAQDWLISEWETACEKALNPVPAWANNEDRPVNALRAIETGCWPTYTQWLAGGAIVFMSVVGTDQACH